MTSEIEPATEARNWLYQPIFPTGWTPAPLYSLATWVNGLAFRDIQFTKVGKPVIKIAEIKGGITGQTKFTTQTFDEKVRVRSGDMLFSWSGQPETSIDVFRWDGPEGWLNQHVFKLTAGEKLLPDFLFYLLRYLKPNFVAIAKNKQTTGLGHVTKRDLERISVAYPTKDEQREIVAILGAIDGRIDALRRINVTLEEMAQALFRSWFLDFDPVRAKAAGREPSGMDGATAAFFPASLKLSELGEEIPEGWAIGPVGSIIDCVGGSTPSTTESLYWDNGVHAWTTPKDFSALQSPILLSSDRKITDQGLAQISSGLLPLGTVLLSSRAPVGYLAISAIPVAINQGFIAMKCNEQASAPFILNWCQAKMAEIKARATGTTFPEISKKNFRPIPMLLPTRKVMNAFTDAVTPLYGNITENLREIGTLDSLRATLLPKFMSGELAPIQSAKEVEIA